MQRTLEIPYYILSILLPTPSLLQVYIGLLKDPIKLSRKHFTKYGLTEGQVRGAFRKLEKLNLIQFEKKSRNEVKVIFIDKNGVSNPDNNQWNNPTFHEKKVHNSLEYKGKNREPESKGVKTNQWINLTINPENPLFPFPLSLTMPLSPYPISPKNNNAQFRNCLSSDFFSKNNNYSVSYQIRSKNIENQLKHKCLESKKDKLPVYSPKPPENKEEWSWFDSFWRHYPRKVGRYKAWQLWHRRKYENDEMGYKILCDISDRSAKDPMWAKNNPYIPHATTYLNQRRWEDEEKITPKTDSKYKK